MSAMGNTKEYVPSPTIKASVVNLHLKYDFSRDKGALVVKRVNYTVLGFSINIDYGLYICAAHSGIF